jgi:hypothetical protein
MSVGWNEVSQLPGHSHVILDATFGMHRINMNCGMKQVLFSLATVEMLG